MEKSQAAIFFFGDLTAPAPVGFGRVAGPGDKVFSHWCRIAAKLPLV
jgi:hypothetical protein